MAPKEARRESQPRRACSGARKRLSSRIPRCNPGHAYQCEQGSLQTQTAPGGVVPLAQGMSASGSASRADGDGLNAQGERNIGVGGGALEPGLFSQKSVGVTQGSQQRGVGG